MNSNLISSPILKNKNWRFLLRDFQQSSVGRAVSGMATQNKLLTYLLAPTSLAYSISQFSPELADRESLNILVAGAELFDAFDRGRWYQYLGWLLGSPNMKVNVALVGNDLGSLDGRTPPPNVLTNEFMPKSLKQATWHKGSVKSFLNGYPDFGKLDVVFFPNPGFSAHVEWFTDDTLDVLFDSGAVMLASAFEDKELPDDLWVAGLSGFGRSKDWKKNPFSQMSPYKAQADYEQIMESVQGNDWGSIVWQIDRVEKTNTQFREQFLNAARRSHESAHEFIDQYGPENESEYHKAANLIGREFKGIQLGIDEFSEELNEATFVTLENAYAVCLLNGNVFNPQDDSWLENINVPRDVLSAFPKSDDEQRLPYPTFLWANWIYFDYVRELHGDVDESNSRPPSLKVPSNIFDGSGLSDEIKEAFSKVMGTSREVQAYEKPLIAALKSGDFAKAKELISKNPELAHASDETCLSVLHYAVQGGNTEFADFLLSETDVDIDVLDGEGWTALMLAVSKNDIDMTTLLLNYDCDVDAYSPLGWSSLLIALSKGHYAIAEMLINECVDIEHANAMGVSAGSYINNNPNIPQSLKDAFDSYYS